MTKRIQLDDLLTSEPYEAHLLRLSEQDKTIPEDELVHAAAKTAQDILARQGAPSIEVTDEDARVAEELFMSHMAGVPNAITTAKLHKPETVVRLEAIMEAYDWRVVQHADQIRMLVTNKLIELSDNRDAKVQLKAVELLGKIADVGMFVEKQEITYKQQSDEEIQKKLKEKLGLLIEGEIIDDKIMSPKEVKQAEHPDAEPLPETPKITSDTLQFLINAES